MPKKALPKIIKSHRKIMTYTCPYCKELHFEEELAFLCRRACSKIKWDKNLPQYVRLNNSYLTLDLVKPTMNNDVKKPYFIYWVDNGGWGVGSKWKKGELYSVSGMKRLDNKRLYRTTKKKWAEHNE